MDWDNPSERFRLIERVGVYEYERLFTAHIRESTVATIAGHAIRPVGSRFGRLFLVGATGSAFQTLAQAINFAAAETIKAAATMADLDDACATLQTACGIESGDGAGCYFSGPNGEGWPLASEPRRAEMLAAWLETEFAEN